MYACLEGGLDGWISLECLTLVMVTVMVTVMVMGRPHNTAVEQKNKV